MAGTSSNENSRSIAVIVQSVMSYKSWRSAHKGKIFLISLSNVLKWANQAYKQLGIHVLSTLPLE
jgi:hypothetical protein